MVVKHRRSLSLHHRPYHLGEYIFGVEKMRETHPDPERVRGIVTAAQVRGSRRRVRAWRAFELELEITVGISCIRVC